PSIAVGVRLLFRAGRRRARPQPAPPRLSELAQGLVRSLPQQAQLPVGVRPGAPPAEQTNEDVAAANPDNVDGIRSFGRVTALTQPAIGSGNAQISISAILFLTPDGAWGDAQEAGLPAGTETVSPRPEVGERSIAYHFTRRTGGSPVEAFYIGFQRDRVEGSVFISGAGGGVSLG